MEEQEKREDILNGKFNLNDELIINDPPEWVLRENELEKQATQLKKTAPDEAIRLLREAESIERDNNPNATGQPQRLRIATVLYEAGRFNEALEILQAEIDIATKRQITEEIKKEADKRFRERIEYVMREYQRTGEAPKPFELKRNVGEWPDFERNLYCLRIYEKIQVCFSKMKDFRNAAVWACAEAYAKYENATHNNCLDNQSLKLDKVEKYLVKAGCAELLPRFKAIIDKYTDEPICEKCWAMIEELSQC